MKKILALVVFAAMLVCSAAAFAQPLDELIVSLVREQEDKYDVGPGYIPNLDETMRAEGVPQGVVDAGGMLRGHAYLYQFPSAGARVDAAWRLDAALTKRGFTPGDFLFEGATYTLYTNPNGGILLMDGMTETTSMVVIGGNFRQEGEEAETPTQLMLTVNDSTREFLFEGAFVTAEGVEIVFEAKHPAGDGYDEVRVVFPHADQPAQTALTMTFMPEG